MAIYRGPELLANLSQSSTLGRLVLTDQIDGITNTFNLGGTLGNFYGVFLNGQWLNIGEQYSVVDSLLYLMDIVPSTGETLEVVFTTVLPNSGTSAPEVEIPEGVMTRSFTTDLGSSVTVGTISQPTPVVPQTITGYPWLTFYWNTSDPFSPITYSSQAWWCNGSGASINAPHTMETLTSVDITIGGNLYQGVIQISDLTLDPNNNRSASGSAILSNEGTDYANIDVVLTVTSCCCSTSLPDFIYLNIDVTITPIWDWTEEFTVLDINLVDRWDLSYAGGIENIDSYFGFTIEHPEPVSELGSLDMNMTMDTVADIGIGTLVPIQLNATIHAQNFREFGYLTISTWADSGILQGEAPSGNMVEAGESGTVIATQTWDGNTRKIKTHLDDGDPITLNNLVVINAILTEVQE